MAATPQEALARIGQRRLLAIARLPSSRGLLPAARALLEGGLDVMEVTWNTPGAAQGLAQLSRELGQHMLLGAGTILSRQAALEALEAGARFLVTPIPVDEVIDLCLEREALPIPGAFSPAEVWACWQRGAPLVKLFPSGMLGPELVSAILGPFPQLRLLPTGGITLEQVEGFLAAGAYAVGLSRLLQPEEVAAEDWPAIRERAREALARAGAVSPR